MKSILSKFFSLALALLMLFSFSLADENAEADDAARAAALLKAVKGTYEPLFPVITDPQYDEKWLDPCAAVLGSENAPVCAEMLNSACCGTLYGAGSDRRLR